MLEQQYQEYIIIDGQFNEFINFVITNNGKLPSSPGKNEYEKKLATFRTAIQYVTKDGKFNNILNKEQLEYLHNSEYESVREIYKVILNRAIENNIEIEYVDELMKEKIIEYNQKKSKISTLKEQLTLEQQYQDYIIIEGQFNEFISYVINNNGELPSQTSVEKKYKNWVILEIIYNELIMNIKNLVLL